MKPQKLTAFLIVEIEFRGVLERNLGRSWRLVQRYWCAHNRSNETLLIDKRRGNESLVLYAIGLSRWVLVRAVAEILAELEPTEVCEVSLEKDDQRKLLLAPKVFGQTEALL